MLSAWVTLLFIAFLDEDAVLKSLQLHEAEANHHKCPGRGTDREQLTDSLGSVVVIAPGRNGNNVGKKVQKRR